MKKFTKLLGIVLIIALVMSISTAAFAVSITVNRDASYDDAATGNRVYTWYRVFTASYTSNSSTAAGPANTDGTPLDVTGTATAVSYRTTAANAAKYGSWVAAVGTPGETGYVEAHWDAGETGNQWFTLTPIAGSTDYTVSWSNSSEAGATVQAAAQWIIDKGAYEDTGTLTYDNEKWTATGLTAGYYVVDSATSGKNLIAATTDITVNEKNAYPTIDKAEKDEDQSDYSKTLDLNSTTAPQTKSKVAVGDTIDYEVFVYVPGDADKVLTVTDTMSAGLSKGTSFKVTVEIANAKGGTYSTLADTNYTVDTTPSNGWSAEIKANDTTRNKWVKFTFSATVTKDALTDTDKENEVDLSYGNYEMHDYVEHETYYAGINKVDKDDNTKKLANVKFTLKEGTVEFPVTKGTDGYYYYDAAGSSEVVTDANGQICIRGLDGDKTYTLTETETNTGYNLLANPVTLTLTLDDKTGTFDVTEFENTFDKVENATGTLLPSTGGIGTTIFYVVGSILVVAAGVLLITKKRMGRE